MKKLLIVLLFSFILCQKNKPSNFFQSTFDSIKCVLHSNILINSFSKIIEAIKTKDLSQIFNTGYSIFLELKKEYIKCDNAKLKEVKHDDENDEDDDIKLGYPRAVLLLYTIIGERAFIWYDEGGYPLLRSNCFYYYGRLEWYCQYIRT